uniref:Uncharacterized protein n=1 Tax=Mustela putorius furo TaxID=9669 RepID=M3Z3M6_MUSPF
MPANTTLPQSPGTSAVLLLFSSLRSNLTFPHDPQGLRERDSAVPSGLQISPLALRLLRRSPQTPLPAPPPPLRSGNWTESREGPAPRSPGNEDWTESREGPAPRSPGNEDWMESREGPAPYLKPGMSRACGRNGPKPCDIAVNHLVQVEHNVGSGGSGPVVLHPRRSPHT